MQEQLIQLLEIPRKLVHGELELEDCPHAGQFDQFDHQCVDCPQGPECQWMCNNDEFAALQQHSTSDLLQALGFALVYVYGAVIKWDHEPDSCTCVLCQWHRQAKSTYDDLATEDMHNGH